jgi:4,5-DOPA dioxygenase extradiol
MNALQPNRHTEAWAEAARSMPVPRAILAISAHWYVGATAVTSMAAPRTIHDFSGFPPELFAVQYPAPGSAWLAARTAELLAPIGVVHDDSAWGLDHGTWSVLVHMYPDAKVPVVQLSIDARLGFDDHVRIGASLDALRDEGVLILGSGNLVHNLGGIDWSNDEGGHAWAVEFDAWAREVLADDPSKLVAAPERSDFALAHPTPDHFIPALYIAGVAVASGGDVRIVTGGCALGSISMTSFAVA